MADNITGDVTIKWSDGVEQTIEGNEFTLEESGKSGENSFDQLYIAHVDHPESDEAGKVYLSTRIDKDSGSVGFDEPEAEGDFEITDSESLEVISPDYEDDDYEQDED